LGQTTPVPEALNPGVGRRIERGVKPSLERLAARTWYQGHWLGIVLAPLGWLYCAAARLRRWAFQNGWLRSSSAPVPVIVVGNLTVGGTGKTPLVLWLVAHLQARGCRPGIALRGYGAAASALAHGAHAGRAGHPERTETVQPDADPRRVGDEALMLAQRAGCPVMVGRDRLAVATALATECGCDLVVSDDGLQHYRLQRQLEILVVDAERRFGSRRCLPAGPLREPVARQREVDLVIENGVGRRSGVSRPDAFRMRLEPGDAVSLRDPQRRRPLRAFADEPLWAVAGIGHPQRFFSMLRSLGLRVSGQPYPDHHAFTAADVEHWPPGPVLMTEKDAVKCRALAGPTHWFVPVTAVPDARFVRALDERLDRLLDPRRQPAPARVDGDEDRN
jgi:tetraacyldisaccharide 4'-kinase